MNISRLILILIFSICLFGCAFEENREVEKKLANSVDNFHALFNQEKFNQIYSGADDELKTKFTEQQFVSYLEVVKNDVGDIELKLHVWIDDELKDGIKRILFRRIDFSTFELVYTEKAIYREKCNWKLREDEAKLAFYKLDKICNKPCHLAISTDKTK